MNLLYSQSAARWDLVVVYHSLYTVHLAKVSYVTITNGQMQSLNFTILLCFCINAFSSENGQKAKPWKRISAFVSLQETLMDPKKILLSHFLFLFFLLLSWNGGEALFCLFTACWCVKLEVKKKKHGCLWISNVSVCEWTRQLLHAWLGFHSHTQ